MSGFLLLIPFLIIRFVLLRVLNKESVQRAAHFAPVQRNEKIAYYIYQISNIALFIYLFFLTVEFDFSWLLQIAIFRGQQGRISRPDRAILNGQF